MLQAFGLSAEQFGELFTVYSAPNVILVLFGGIWCDRYGVVRMSLLFNVTMLLGMIVFALAPMEPEVNAEGMSRASVNSMRYLLVGRLLLGLGGECLCAAARSVADTLCAAVALSAQRSHADSYSLVRFVVCLYSAMIGSWFKGSPILTFACGWNQAFVQLFGSAAAFLVLPRIMQADATPQHAHSSSHSHAGVSHHHGFAPAATEATLPGAELESHVRLCLWVTVGVCALALASNLAYAAIDLRYREKYMPAEDDDDGAEEDDEDYVAVEEDDSYLTGSGEQQLQASRAELMGDATSPHTPRESAAEMGALQRLRSFPALFWIVLTMHGLLSPILYTFTAFGPVSLMELYGLSEFEAARVTSLLYITIVLSPLLGYFIDRVGYRSVWQVVASCAIPITLALMLWGMLSPMVVMLSLGLAYAVTESNGLAMLAVVVPSSSLGTAYGLVGVIVSIALLFEPYLVGLLKVQTGSYTAGNLMFVVVSAVGAGMAMLVYSFDAAHAQIMCKSAEASKPIKLAVVEQ